MRKLIAKIVPAALPLAIMTLLLAITTIVSAQGFIPAQAPPWVYADNYGRWAIQSQGANTYTFQRSTQNCLVTQLDFKNKTTFYAFANTLALAPVLISDITQANSEVVTPGSYFTPTQSSCGANLSPANNHTTFTLQSGTGGLQEALNAVGATTAPYVSVIYLTPEWYKLISNISGQNATLAASVQPQLVINAATCSTQVSVVDITTTPSTVYSCNGSGKLVPISTGTGGFFNQGVTSYTQLTAPSPLSTASTTTGILTTAATGGTIPASSTYRLAVTYVDASGGETLISTDSASTATIATGTGSTNSISVTSPAAETGAVGYRLYVTAASGTTGTEILYSPTCSSVTSRQPLQSVFPTGTVCPIGSTATVAAIVTGTATVPSINTAFARTSGASGSFPAFPALGAVSAAATGVLGEINFPAGYLNTLGRKLEIKGAGYATVNGTTGTLTLATPLFSIPGVTSVTPFTSGASGTTSASATIPIKFDVVYETAATGTTGTLEAHGCASFQLAGTTATTSYCDITIVVSSTVDLTKQDQLEFTIVPATTAITAAQLRQLEVIVLN